MTTATGHLAVIDMQRVFAEPDSPWATPRFAEAAAGVRRLLPAFDDRVTFTRFLAPGNPRAPGAPTTTSGPSPSSHPTRRSGG